MWTASKDDPRFERFASALARAMHALKVSVGDDQVERMFAHYQQMVLRNRVMNLTRITDPADAAAKHYADSLALHALALRRDWMVATMLDIGTGAGFPAVPIAIVRPQWKIHAIDGTKKKIGFVAEAAEQLGLTNLTTEHAHLSHWQTDRQFDLAASRAVAVTGEFLHQAGRLLRAGGRLVIFQSGGGADSPLDSAEFEETSLCQEENFSYELTGKEAEIIRRLLRVLRRQ